MAAEPEQQAAADRSTNGRFELHALSQLEHSAHTPAPTRLKPVRPKAGRRTVRGRRPAAHHSDAPSHAAPDDRRALHLIIGALVALLVAVVIVTVISLAAFGGSDTRSDASRSLPPYWTVRRGDTYATIAAKTGLSVEQLQTFNPYQDTLSLRPGQHIKLRLNPPPLRPKRLGPRFWIVRRGQTFASISAKTGHSIYALQRLNPRLKPSALQPGQRMRLRR